jgi:hypothetical protein
MQFLVCVRSDQQELWYGACLVQVDKEDVQVLSGFKELFQMVKSRDDSLYEMYFWDRMTVSFYESPLYEDFLSEEEHAELDSNDILKLPDAREISKALGNPERTECDQFIVVEEGVRFMAIPKHCDYRIETASTITWDMLLEVLKDG